MLPQVEEMRMKEAMVRMEEKRAEEERIRLGQLANPQ